ncbi:hypothetical protein MASR1M107_08630 [Ignavibacteriales bacterium]
MITTETLRQIFDQSQTAVFVTQKQAFVYTNAAFCDLLGLTDSSHILGKQMEIITVNPNYSLLIDKNIEREKTGLPSNSYKLLLHRSDGVIFPATLSVSSITFEDNAATLMIVQDVTFEKKSTDDLEDISHMLMALYENTSESIVLIDRNTRMIYFNNTVRQIVENIYKKTPQRGDSILDYATLESKQGFIQNLNSAFNGIAINKDVQLNYPDGSKFWWKVSYKPIKSSDGNIHFVAFLAMNITETVLARETLELQNDRLNSLHKLMNIEYLTEKEIVHFALEEVVRLTKSEVGYIHFVETEIEGNIELNLFSWSKSVDGKCQIPDIVKYPIKDAGVWADCIRTGKPAVHNDYQNLEVKHG